MPIEKINKSNCDKTLFFSPIDFDKTVCVYTNIHIYKHIYQKY